MTTYYITFFSVFVLAAIAQAVDYPCQSKDCELEVQHSIKTGFFFFLSVLILVFVAGLRYYVGTDYSAYYHGYWAAAQNLKRAIISFEEPGYPFLCRIAMLFGGGGATSIFLAALVTIWPAMKVIYRHTDRLLIASLLYVFLGCWSGSFNVVGQYLAATMLFCGYSALGEKKFWRYMAWVFAAFLFHRSASLMALLFFAVHRKVSVKNLLILILGTIIILLAFEQVISFASVIMESEYSLRDEYTAHTVNILRVLAECAPAVVFMTLLWNSPKDEQTTFYLNLLVIHAAIRVATMNSALLYRIGIYTTLFQVIAIPELLKRIRLSARKTIIVPMILLYSYFWWYEIINNTSLNHFRWIWQR